MATLLSVGAESALLCLLQTHSSLQEDTWDRDCTTTCSPCSACWWPSTATTAASTGVSSAAQTRHKSQLFTRPLMYTLLSAGLWVSFAPWLDGNCLIQLSFTWGLHYFQKLSPASHTNQRNYCCSIMFLHCHSWETKWALLYSLLYSRPGDCLMLFWFKKVSGNFQFFLFSSRR